MGFSQKYQLGTAVKIPPPRRAAGSCRGNPALVVGKGEGGGKLNQGKDDDKPGGPEQQQEQGVDDDPAPGEAPQAGPETGPSPGKLLGEQEDDQQKTGKDKDGPDNGAPEAKAREGAAFFPGYLSLPYPLFASDLSFIHDYG